MRRFLAAIQLFAAKCRVTSVFTYATRSRIEPHIEVNSVMARFRPDLSERDDNSPDVSRPLEPECNRGFPLRILDCNGLVGEDGCECRRQVDFADGLRQPPG